MLEACTGFQVVHTCCIVDLNNIKRWSDEFHSVADLPNLGKSKCRMNVLCQRTFDQEKDRELQRTSEEAIREKMRVCLAISLQTRRDFRINAFQLILCKYQLLLVISMNARKFVQLVLDDY